MILALRIWIRIKNILIGSTAYNLIILGYAGGRLHTEGLYAEERGQEAGLHQGNYLCSDGQLSRKREVFFWGIRSGRCFLPEVFLSILTILQMNRQLIIENSTAKQYLTVKR